MRRNEGTIHSQYGRIPKHERCRHSGSITDHEGEIEVSIVHRIKVGWLKWRRAFEILCDHTMPMKLKEKWACL